MALASPAACAAASNGVAGISPYMNLHSASPGTTGANELTSTRQAVTWTTATSGSPNPSNTSALTFTIAATTTAAFFGTYSAVTAGVYAIGGALSPSVTTGSSAGTVTIAAGAATITST